MQTNKHQKKAPVKRTILFSFDELDDVTLQQGTKTFRVSGTVSADNNVSTVKNLWLGLTSPKVMLCSCKNVNHKTDRCYGPKLFYKHTIYPTQSAALQNITPPAKAFSHTLSCHGGGRPGGLHEYTHTLSSIIH